MKCPFCGSDMKEGEINSSHPIIFTNITQQKIFTNNNDKTTTTEIIPAQKAYICSNASIRALSKNSVVGF